MKGKHLVIILAVITVAIVLIGQSAVYWNNNSRFDSEASLTDKSVNYSLHTNLATTYSVTLFSDDRSLDTLYIYKDSKYAMKDISNEDLDYLIEEIRAHLKNRSFTSVKIINAEELRTLMLSGTAGNGLLMMSGAFPSTVYNPEGDCKNITDWVSKGNSLYWIGAQICKYCAVDNKIVDVKNYDTVQNALFGVSGCVNPDATGRVTTRSSDPLSRSMQLNFDNVSYGLNSDMIYPGGAIFPGFISDRGYSSISLVGNGAGTIAVFGNDYGAGARMSLSDVVASGITHKSVHLGDSNGKIDKQTVNGSIQIDVATNNMTLYVQFGNPNVINAKSHPLRV